MSLKKRKEKKFKNYSKQIKSNIILPFLFLKISIKFIYHEIKVLKNKKIVYINSLLLNSYSTPKNIKKLNKITFIGQNKGSSKYRGLTKMGINGRQALMMLKKSYIGTYDCEEFGGI